MDSRCKENILGFQPISERIERIHRREKTSWKTKRGMVRSSGQGWYEVLEMRELEKVGRGQRWLEAED